MRIKLIKKHFGQYLKKLKVRSMINLVILKHGLCNILNAFDVINQDIILKKMNNYGIRGIAHDWFEN